MNRLDRLRGHIVRQAGTSALQPRVLSRRFAKAEEEQDVVLYEVVEGGVGVITLNRPKSYNAMTDEVQLQFMEKLRRAAEDPNVRVIVVTGAGKGFCVGAEMKSLQNLKSGKPNSEKATVAKGKKKDLLSIEWWRPTEVSKPIIAAINGSCAGLGFVAAAMCDIRFTVKHAKFTSAFAKRGLVAEHGISYILPRIVGVSNALDILMSSRIFQGQEAKELGFVSRVYEDKETLMHETMKYARDMANLCSPASLAEMKTQVYKDLTKEAGDAGRYSQTLMRKSFGHPDFKEGVDSYVQKRDPNFQGTNYGRIADL